MRPSSPTPTGSTRHGIGRRRAALSGQRAAIFPGQIMTAEISERRELRKRALISAAQAEARKASVKSLSLRQFCERSGYKRDVVFDYFGSIDNLLEAAGLDRHRPESKKIDRAELFPLMWKAFVKQGGVSSQAEFSRNFERHKQVVKTHLGTWPEALRQFRSWLRESGKKFPYVAALDRRIEESERRYPAYQNVKDDSMSQASRMPPAKPRSRTTQPNGRRHTKKAQVFIGSSAERHFVAEAIQESLENGDIYQVQIWSQGVFGLSENTLDSLEKKLVTFDFGIFVLTGDDVKFKRAVRALQPRDNVLFELGLFMGHLSRKRTFIVCQRGVDLRLPTDLSGITVVDFKLRGRDQVPAAVGSACAKLRRAMDKEGPRKR